MKFCKKFKKKMPKSIFQIKIMIQQQDAKPKKVLW